MKPVTFLSYIEYLPKLRLHCAIVPKQIVIQAGGIGSRHLCSLNSGEKFHCGLVSYGEGRAYIIVNKRRLISHHLAKGDEVMVSIMPDTSKYGMKMPEELDALLEQDEEGAQLFEDLTPGQKRYIIHYVSQVKSSQKKIDRAILLINNLKTMSPEKFDFRYLLGLPPREK